MAVRHCLARALIRAEDMRKMHSYREAIGRCPGPGAKPVESVWVLHPGTELRSRSLIRSAEPRRDLLAILRTFGSAG